eukprot:gene32877-42554_t
MASEQWKRHPLTNTVTKKSFHDDIAEWAVKNGCPKDEHSRGRISFTKAKRLELSVYVKVEERKDGEEAKKIIIWPEGTSIMSVVARNGNLEMIQWLKEMKCPKDRNTFSEAARGCHVEVLDWLQESYGWPDAGWDAVDRTCDAIASTGRLDILKWAIAKGCPWDVHCASTCASGGHMEMFRWILDERFFMMSAFS